MVLRFNDSAKPSTGGAFLNIIYKFDIEGVIKYKVNDVRAIKDCL